MRFDRSSLTEARSLLSEAPWLVMGVWLADVRADLVEFKSDRGNRLAPRPEGFAGARPLLALNRSGAGHSTFAFEKPADRGHRLLGWNLHAHGPVVRHQMPVRRAALFLAGQLVEAGPHVFPKFPRQHLPAPLGDEHEVMLAIPLGMGQALIRTQSLLQVSLSSSHRRRILLQERSKLFESHGSNQWITLKRDLMAK